MNSTEQWHETDRLLSEALVACRDRLMRLWEEREFDPRLKAMAVHMANESSGGYADQITLGQPGGAPMVVDGKGKMLTCLFQAPGRSALVLVSSGRGASDRIIRQISG